MIFDGDRAGLRRMYADAWRKRSAALPMSALESQIADVIGLHPEYHDALAEPGLDRDYAPEEGATNPFLHMGLHLAVRDQVATDRPPGVRRVFTELAGRAGDAHAAEHRMIDCLAETLWEAQRNNGAPDEQRYLARLERLAGLAT